ncbi:MAG TPA: hypothetical protein VFV99_23510 [Kofleriaceae bacterium]|nr:hypothetical protein [Kofleriaceae bacterium]
MRTSSYTIYADLPDRPEVIEELERRLELVQATAAATNWGCDKCAVDCNTVCEQYLICSTDVFHR